MSPFEVRYGMVVVGEGGEHVLVRAIDGPIPVAACWAPFRFTGPDLRTGRTCTIVVPQLRSAEVLPLPERPVEFVCRQGGELLLWDAAAGAIVSLPEAAHPGWLGELQPNTPVAARFYQGHPVWVCARSDSSTALDPARGVNSDR